jgi:hypothetical protein
MRSEHARQIPHWHRHIRFSNLRGLTLPGGSAALCRPLCAAAISFLVNGYVVILVPYPNDDNSTGFFS